MISLLSILKLLSLSGLSMFFVDYEDGKREFEKNKENMHVLCEYLIENNYKDVYISFSIFDDKITLNGEKIEFDKFEKSDVLTELKRDGYKVIVRNDNTIHFQRWSNMDSGCGIAYVTNGDVPKLQFLTRLKSLPKKNWYYYEENYNEWRKKHDSMETYNDISFSHFVLEWFKTILDPASH